MCSMQSLFESLCNSPNRQQRVRHHKRQQPYGPGRQYRRERHIDSYLRRKRDTR